MIVLIITTLTSFVLMFCCGLWVMLEFFAIENMLNRKQLFLLIMVFIYLVNILIILDKHIELLKQLNLLK